MSRIAPLPFGTPIPKPEPKSKKERKYIRQIGKVGLARQADRRRKLKEEPPNHEGYRVCYICLGWFTHVDLEHEEDASTHPELRHVKSNHKWACNPCNIKKKQKSLQA